MRTHFFGELTNAIHRAIKTQRYCLIYLNSGHCNAWQIDQEVDSANEAQKVARDAYVKHINEHGCGTGT